MQREIPPDSPSSQDEDRPLNPELVEEDFVETTDIVRRYAMNRTDFSLRQLFSHLTRNHVVITDQGAGFTELFEEMQPSVVGHYEEQGHHVGWHQHKAENRIARYTLGLVVEAESGRQTLSSPLAAVIRPPRSDMEEALPQPRRRSYAGKAERPSRHQKPDTDRYEPNIRLILEAEESRTIRPGALRKILVEQGLPEAAAAKAIEEAVSSGSLFRYKRGKTARLSLEPVGTDAGASPPAGDEQDKTRLLTEKEVGLAISILDTMTKAGSQIQQGATIKMLEAKIGDGVTRRELRQLLRALESNRFVTISHSDNYGKARKSPRVTIRGQDMKQRWRANRDGYIGRIKAIQI